MTTVLRKTHGAFSAGTPVVVHDRDARHKMNLCEVRGIELHVHDDDLVERRSCEHISTQPPRWVRRKVLSGNSESSQQESSEEVRTVVQF